MREGWEIKTLGEVCDISAGQGAPQGEDNYCLDGTPFIKAGNLEALVNGEREQSVQKVSKEVALSHRLVLQKKGSIVFAKSGMSCMKGYVYTLQQDCYVVSHLAILFPKSVSGQYLNYALHFFKPSSLAKNASFPSITLKDLAIFPIPFPTSLQEQLRIVDILDREFAKIDALKANAEKSLQAAKDLFQATLKKELGGKTKNLATLLSICQSIVDCPHSTPIKSAEKTNFPCIRTSELKAGRISWATMQYVSEDEYRKRITRLQPQEGDIVYGREGTIGDAVMLPTGYHFCLGQRTMLFRPNRSLINPKYLLYCVISPFVYNQAMSRNTGCGVAHVNVADVKQFLIPVPEQIDEQRRIVSYLDALNDKCSKLQENYQKILTLCDDLKQSLLRKAFNGEL